ncbi:Cell division protein FtsZ [Hyphomicrobium sulfonivorans]|uniref:Cell division protein FtsZ n=1 Tax=Hyphomicrobium sulfonivorans TaxID=121290 RepID=A0A120CT90_HYPSL|nr:cell division protein FtsZ [Hyphomicrobium sulfonivorans]KWT64287.1 Cell division protein FtsZ [Hyphomicrobium sulfonivorans]
MSIKLQLPKLTDLKPRIIVVGVGGAGCNAINNMISAGLEGVEFVVANTDAQALATSTAEHRLQLGASLTEGLGAGSKPEIGEAAAEEAIEDIRAQIAGAHMVFIAAGMGGGTGTGAAAVIARAAKELGILAVGIVTKPFHFEGARRMRVAEAGIAEIRKHVDTLIVIPNQNLFRIANEKTTFAEAFVLADQVLYSGVACIVDLIIKEGLINLDFADVRTVMSGMGSAVMGTGEASGEHRASIAAEEAIANPLLDDVSLRGARGLLLSITGGSNLTLYEVDEAASRVRQEVDPEANIIVGATFDDSLGDKVRVSIVASGLVTPPAAGQDRNDGHSASAPPAPPHGYTGAQQREDMHLAPPSQPGGMAMQQAPANHFQPAPGFQAAPEMAPPASRPLAQQQPTHQQPPPHPQPQRSDAGRSFPQPIRSSEEDMQRRLSEAIGGEASGDQVQAHGHGQSQNHSQGQPVSGEVWRAPGNVVIEEGFSQLSWPRESAARRTGQTQGQPPSAAQPATGAFVPAPPADLRRNGRRMPEVEDFPPLAQREYRAKASFAETAHAEDLGQLPPAVPQSAGEEPQRRGILQRIMARTRRDDVDGGVAHQQRERQGDDRYDQGYDNRPRGGDGRQSSSPVTDSWWEPGNESQEVDSGDDPGPLPEFFNRRR